MLFRHRLNDYESVSTDAASVSALLFELWHASFSDGLLYQLLGRFAQTLPRRTFPTKFNWTSSEISPLPSFHKFDILVHAAHAKSYVVYQDFHFARNFSA